MPKCRCEQKDIDSRHRENPENSFSDPSFATVIRVVLDKVQSLLAAVSSPLRSKN